MSTVVDADLHLLPVQEYIIYTISRNKDIT